MKKSNLLLVQVIVMLTAFSCIISGGSRQPIPYSQVPSDFELWSEGKLPNIHLTSGQENLENYREQFKIQINGVDENGNNFSGFQEYLIDNDRTSDKSREIQTIETPSRYMSGVNEWIVTDKYTYTVRDLSQGGRICEKLEIPADSNHYSNVHVTRILLSITPGELLEENAQVQNVSASVYDIENLSLLFVRELNAVNGKVWIAKKPSFFLKAEGTIDGVFEFENIRYNGEASFHYEIKDIDKVEVQLPALCAHPPRDMIPLPKNALEVVDFPNLITFSSPDDVNQVLNYYLNELDSQGWQIEETQSDPFETIVSASLLSEKGVQLLVEIKIIDMASGSYIKIHWQAQ